jgi:hypothetical protein
LRGGAVIVFGDNMLETVEQLRQEAGDAFIIAAQRAQDLPLPHTLMLWALLLFEHSVPGVSGRGPTSEEGERWKAALGDSVRTYDNEPAPTDVRLICLAEQPNATMQVQWGPGAAADWQGVYSSQVKRVAESLDRCHQSALRPDAEARLPFPDWERFAHPEGLFTLAYPGKWRKMASNQGAALSCLSSDGGLLLEVVCLHSDARRGPHEPHFVDVVADGPAKITPFEPGFRDGRLLLRRDLSHSTSGKSVRVVISFTEHGMDLTSDYFIAGNGNDALYVAMKTLTSRYQPSLDEFQRVLSTLETPWLDAIGARSAIQWRP